MVSPRVWALAQNASTFLNNAWHQVLPGNSELWTERSVKAGGCDPHQMQSLRFTPRRRDQLRMIQAAQLGRFQLDTKLDSSCSPQTQPPQEKRAAIVQRGGSSPHGLRRPQNVLGRPIPLQWSLHKQYRLRQVTETSNGVPSGYQQRQALSVGSYQHRITGNAVEVDFMA